MTDSDDTSNPPEHMAVMSWMSQSYREDVDRLKRGGQSGISSTFGLAADLLPESLLEEAPENDAEAAYKKPLDSELAGRTLYLSYMLREHCADYLNVYLKDLRKSGIFFDLTAGQSAQVKEAIASALKNLTVISIYLLAWDTGIVESKPGWLRSFLGLSLGASDVFLPEPSSKSLLSMYQKKKKHSPSLICQETAKSVCSILDIDISTTPHGDPIEQFLLACPPNRIKLLRRALEEPFELVSTILDILFG